MATNAKPSKNRIEVNNVLVSNPGDITNEFNSNFSNIGKKRQKKFLLQTTPSPIIFHQQNFSKSYHTRDDCRHNERIFQKAK